MKVRVIYSVWGADGFDEPLHGGEHDLDVGAMTEEQHRSLAGGEAGGALEIVDPTRAERKLLDAHVQSQEDGEKAYAAAVESGEWQEGNVAQFDHEVATGARPDSLDVAAVDVADATEALS